MAFTAIPADTVVRYTQSDSTRYKGIAIRTNLAYAASATPNLGFEIPVGDRFSLGLNTGLKPWPRWLAWDWDKMVEKKWRHFLIAPEFRFWPSGIYDELFIGADLIYTHYNVGSVKFPFGMYPAVRNYRLQGDFYGMGVFVGWSWWLSDHFRLEAEAGIGAGYANAKKYECAYCGAELGSHRGPVLIPKVGINLVYNITGRQKPKKYLEISSVPSEELLFTPEPLKLVIDVIDAEDDQSAKEINDAIVLWAYGDYAGALKALEAKRDDPRSDNAYAVALYYNGLEAEAIEILKKAAEAGDERAASNLKQIEEYNRNRK